MTQRVGPFASAMAIMILTPDSPRADQVKDLQLWPSKYVCGELSFTMCTMGDLARSAIGTG